MNSNYQSETLVKVERLNEALAARQSTGARWWSYTASHQSFELLVGDPSGQENIVIVLAACEHLSGPTSWQAQRLSASIRLIEDGAIFEMSDPEISFLARSRMLAWKKNFDLLKHLRVE